MRIGIDARFYTSTATGIGRYVYELIDHLLQIDQKNHYVLFFNEPEFTSFKTSKKNVEKILADAPHYSLREQLHFWRVLKKARLDVMHFTHFNGPILYRGPSIVTIHDLTLHLYPGNKMNNVISRLAYSITIRSIVGHAKKVIAVSHHTKEDLMRFLHTPASKISVVHLGVTTNFHPIQDTHLIGDFLKGLDVTQPYVLYTGVWRSHKNLVNLIKAFSILKKKHGFPGLLVITGKEDPWYPEVKETVCAEKLEGAVRFTGLVPDEDLVLLYNGASVYVLPSLYEGFGLPVLEAFACGVPVCAANTSSLPEVCGPDNAALFDPHSPPDIAEKIASVYNNPEKRETLRRRGFARLKDFSWEKTARCTLELYEYVYSASKNSA